jgi:hypothetical protein
MKNQTTFTLNKAQQWHNIISGFGATVVPWPTHQIVPDLAKDDKEYKEYELTLNQNTEGC